MRGTKEEIDQEHTCLEVMFIFRSEGGWCYYMILIMNKDGRIEREEAVSACNDILLRGVHIM